MDTRIYKVKIELETEIEAPNDIDAREMIDDHYGVGSGGEGVNVTAVTYEFE